MPPIDNHDDLDDDEVVEMSADMAAALKAEEEAKKATADDDDDDFDLLGESDDDDDAEDDGDDGDDVDDGDDNDDDAPAAKTPSVTDIPKVKRKKQTAEERIAELAEKRRDAEAAQFAAEMRAIELEQRIAALETGRPAQTATTELKEPKPDDFKYGEVDPDYVEARINYGVEQKLAAERAKFEGETVEQKKEAARQHYEKRLADIMTKGSGKHADFETKVKSVKFDGEIARMILDSEQGVDISYYLANNISKLRELTMMDTTKRAIAVGRLEERFAARASAGKKRSSAPNMPGSNPKKKRVSAEEAKYGPRDQNAFDKAYNGVS